MQSFPPNPICRGIVQPGYRWIAASNQRLRQSHNCGRGCARLRQMSFARFMRSVSKSYAEVAHSHDLCFLVDKRKRAERYENLSQTHTGKHRQARGYIQYQQAVMTGVKEISHSLSLPELSNSAQFKNCIC